MRIWLASLVIPLLLQGCISPDNKTFDGMGTPDITQCGTIPGVGDGINYVPRVDSTFASDGEQHPDIFYMAWSQLDSRSDLRFPARGYSDDGYEDKLLVSRENLDGSIATWQLLPALEDSCVDAEKVRIHSFDMAPDGRSLFISMRRDDHPRLAIYEYNIYSRSYRKITHDDNHDFTYPTYVGDDAQSGHRTLFVSKTVDETEIPVIYAGAVLLDEYDRAPTPLIHRLDAETGDTLRIGLNNSHQTEPVLLDRENGTPLVVFTQWEHQASVNRFSLWKTQIDGSDNFTFLGQESRTDASGANLFQPRQIKSGPYAGYVIATEGARSNHRFAAEGNIVVAQRNELDLRSDLISLSRVDASSGMDLNLARNPEHYNDSSFVYSFRDSVDNGYGIYLKEYPSATAVNGPGMQIIADSNYHFIQPRSFSHSAVPLTAPDDGVLGEGRSSYTNMALNGRSGFLVQNLIESDNGVQHQLDGTTPDEISLQFFAPSQTFSDSRTIGVGNSPEMSIPASGFISPESDGSIGVVMKSGLYVWKVNKSFNQNGNKFWIPVRAERQEVSFVPNRVNACNQCHQERSQQNIDRYTGFSSIASAKMEGDLSNVTDISNYDTAADVPDFHADIMPMFTTPNTAGVSCASCHGVRDKLNLGNTTGPEARTATWRALSSGAYKLPGTEETVPYLSASINPIAMDNKYGPAPFLWSLLLNDDLSRPPEAGYPNDASRNLDRSGDYGAAYDARIEAAIADVNGQYDHSSHWSAAQVQHFITYSSTQVPVGLSDRISFVADGVNGLEGAGAQRAYQALVRNCFDCHNNHAGAGIDAPGLGLPLEKRFSGATDIKSAQLRLVIDSHLANKGDTTYAPYEWQSNLEETMYRTLESARYRVNYANPDESELLVYARADALHGNVAHNAILSTSSADYIALRDWILGLPGVNQLPQLDTPLAPLVLNEYDDPQWIGPLTWSDPDGDLSQLMLSASASSEHIAGDSMLALDYTSLTSAMIKGYAILGDRGDHQIEMRVTDGEQGVVTQTVPVTITSDYIVPPPIDALPTAYAFYTVRETGELRKIDSSGNDVSVGIISHYSTDWTTVYRRADRGWLYFFNQEAQQVTIVDESNAVVLSTIQLDHAPNRETATHKQTVSLLWWRPADGVDGSSSCPGGELQGMLESKLSLTMNGDFYVGLGCGDGGTVVPEYRTRLADGGNTISVYVWRRATFMSKWVVEGIDRLNVLNLVTGKSKPINDYRFAETLYNGTLYPARDYMNVRAVVVAEDGAFYGFNKDLDAPIELFNFDPIEGVQQPLTMPTWLEGFMSNYQLHATPFLVIEPRL